MEVDEDSHNLPDYAYSHSINITDSLPLTPNSTLSTYAWFERHAEIQANITPQFRNLFY